MHRKLSSCLDSSKIKILQDGTNTIIREVDAMRGLVDEFSKFARLPVLKPVLGDINLTVQEAVDLFREAGERGASISVTKADNLPKISFDGEQIRRVIINLLDNALKAVEDMGPDGLVTVSTMYLREDGVVAVSVADNGTGISGDYLDRIFDPYFSTREGGIGLGLAIAQRIAEEHGGILTYTSGTLGGTVFTVKLPVDIDPVRRV
jgi:two-component system nitrogen regulation sensor histidine kinase NtrY